MDSSDHSPQSENTGSSWLQCWENEIGSLSGLNLSGDIELSSLVEDKEIAARAVAFVVNSTRKGIVPLCADVANLLRSKRSLEKKVFLLKRENEVLRSSLNLSHSTSPTPASLSSEKGSYTEHACQPHDKGRPCSRCSQASSTISNSPQFENRQRLSSLQHSPASSVESKGRRHSSPRFNRSKSSNRMQGGITTKAVVHQPPREITPSFIEEGKFLNVQQFPSKKIERKNSLPDIVSVPDTSIQKVNPKNTSALEIQCSPDHTTDDQFMETVRLNSRLAEDLGAAKKEIEMLKSRLKQIEGKQSRSHCRDDCYLENECDQSGFNYLEDQVMWLNNNNSHNSKHSHFKGGHRSSSSKKVHPISALYPEPLQGCKCSACVETFGSDINLAQNLPHALSETNRRFSVSHKLQVQMNDYVVCKGDRTGIIRYIGHLDGHGQSNMLYMGLELDSPTGKHDGYLDGKRYFYCNKGHGLFVPIQEIICKVSKKNAKKHILENSEKSSRRRSSVEITKLEDNDSVFS